MANIILHRRALELRKLGKSYSQIKHELGVSKSTLSEWLRAFPLSRERINALRGNSEQRIERYRMTMRKKREIKLLQYYEDERQKWLPLSDKEVFIAGLFLYWGEGNKSQRNIVSINNTDPSVVKFTYYWLVRSLKVPKEKVHVFIHLYDDMDIEDELDFWSKELRISRNQFSKPYIKKSKKSSIDQKGFGHGTCGVRVGNTVLKERLLMAIKAISQKYNEELGSI